MLLLRIVIFTVLVPGAVTIGVPYILLHSTLDYAIGIGPTLRILGLLPLSAGWTVYAWCAWDFGRVGRGTPAPYDPPQRLVTRGLYQFTRNPIYVGIGLIILGEALLFDSVPLFGYAVLLLVLFHLRVLFYEEPRLRAKFGTDYDEYCRAVPRWLPRVAAKLSG